MTNPLQLKNPNFFDDIEFSVEVEKLIPFSGVLTGNEPVLDNVVTALQVLYTASYFNGDTTFVVKQRFTPGVPYPESADGFIDYASLTEEQVVSWLVQQPSHACYQNSLASSIEEQMNAAEEPALPWA